MANDKTIILLGVFFFFQVVNPTLGFPALTTFGDLPAQALSQSQSVFTKVVDTTKSGVDTGLNTASSLSKAGFDQGNKLKDQAFTVAKSFAGTATSKVSETASTATKAADQATSSIKSFDVSNTANKAVETAKSNAESASKAANSALEAVTSAVNSPATSAPAAEKS